MKLVAFLLALLFITAITLPGAAQVKRVKDHTGLYAVTDAKGKWGFIDRTGHFRIPASYEGANEFSDGVAYVYKWKDQQKQTGIVDPSGKFTPLEMTGSDLAFHEGLARIESPVGNERIYGYMDKTGRVVIKPQFFFAGHFSEGLAWVGVLKEREWLYGFIDQTGKFVIEPQFVHQPGDFVDGMAKVMGKIKSGFIDRTGRYRITADYEQTDSFFSEGLLATVIQGNPSRGVYLDRDGKAALEIPFWQQRSAWQRSLYTIRRQQLAPFQEGLAAVLSFNKIGFIDRSGKVVIEPEFRETNGFAEGLAAVKIIGSDGQYVWGYIDRKGSFVIEPRFIEAQPFAGGLARVSTVDGAKQLIDKKGKVIWRAAKQ